VTIDPSLQVALCTALESIINKALQYDPGSRYALAKLQGKVLAVELNSPTLTLFLLPDAEGVRVQSIYDGDTTTRIKGSPLSLLSLLTSQQINLANSGVEVFGNTGFLIDLQRILQNLDIDWEEALSGIVGDVAGPQVGHSVRGLQQWLVERKQSFNRLFSEFLTEEIRATPSVSELKFFYQQVDKVRLATDRAAATLQHLRAQRLLAKKEAE